MVWRADDASVARLWVGEWDLLAGRFFKQRRLREADGPDSAVRVERAGDSLLILVSGFQSASRTELIRVDLDLVEQGSVSLTEGFLGSLVLISRDLRLLAPLPTTTAPIEDEASSSVMGERVTQRMFGRTVSTAVRQGQWVMRVR